MSACSCSTKARKDWLVHGGGRGLHDHELGDAARMVEPLVDDLLGNGVFGVVRGPLDGGERAAQLRRDQSARGHEGRGPNGDGAPWVARAVGGETSQRERGELRNVSFTQALPALRAVPPQEMPHRSAAGPRSIRFGAN